MMASGAEEAVSTVIGLLSAEGMTKIMDEETRATTPATSLQISFTAWKNLMPRILKDYSDNEIRQLAYSSIPEVRRFVADLAVLQVRQGLNEPPIEPGHAIVISTKLQDALSTLQE